MTRLIAVLAVISMACGPELTTEAPAAVATATDALLSCPVSTAGGGTIGSSNVSLLSTLSIASIQADGTGVLTVKAFDIAGWSGVGVPSVSQTKLISLGNGVVATGTFGDPLLMANITGVSTRGNVATFTGSQLGPDNVWRTITGNITISNAQFDGNSGSGFLRLTYLSSSGGSVSTLALVQSSPISYSSTSLKYAAPCAAFTVAEAGTTGTVTFSVTAAGATGVSYYIDGQRDAFAGSTLAPFTVSFNSQPWANGSHTVKAIAVDEGGNRVVSAPVSFSLANDKSGPSVAAAVSGTMNTIVLSATATDPAGVTKVEFLIDNVLRGTDTVAPFSLDFNSRLLSTATHSLTARATDGLGNVATSPAVSFTTTNDLTAPTMTFAVSGTTGVITLTATASDASGIARVDFRLGSVVIGSVSTAPYTMTYDSRRTPNGTNNFYADAYDINTNKASVYTAVAVSNATTAEVESNATIALATATYTNTVKGTGYTGPTDPDFFKVVVGAGRTLRAETAGTAGSTYIELAVFDAAGTQLGISATPGFSGEVVSVTNTSAASVTWYIKVYGQANGPVGQQYYVLIDR